MRKIVKNKFVSGFVVIMTICWAIGLSGILTPLFYAQAALTTTSENMIDTMNMPAGMMAPIMAIGLTGSNSETLHTIRVDFLPIQGDPSAEDVIADFSLEATDNQGLSIYVDANDDGWFDPMSDTILPLQSIPSWQFDAGTGLYYVVLDILDYILPNTLNAGKYNMFLHAKTKDDVAAGLSFNLSIPARGFTMTARNGTMDSTAITSGVIVTSGAGNERPFVVSATYKNPTKIEFAI